MKVLMAASEVAPFAKTGGLADMVSMLSGALGKHNVTVDIIMPLYKTIKRRKYKLKKTKAVFAIDVGGREISGRVWEAPLPGLDPEAGKAYFIENKEFFDRPNLYADEEGDYPDNCERFVFFCRSVLSTVLKLKINPDLIHCHDWQTALIPVYLKTLYRRHEGCRNIKSLLTIHNLAYQGLFWHWDWPLTGLDWSLFNWQGLEFYGKINLLKGGVVFADAITTVSKTYSQEIKTPEYGCGLEGVFSARNKAVCGVVNGLDYDLWNPETDKVIETNYSINNLSGKSICKSTLQRECGLHEDAQLPILGMVGRLAEQKGYDLLAECLDLIMLMDVQICILGTGSRHYQKMLKDFQHKYKGRLYFKSSFDENLGRKIFAGSDIFLMPSRFEPCGLAQLIALRYGTIPIVHATGGLADTIQDVVPENLISGSSTGFVFLEYNIISFMDQVMRALKYFEDMELWQLLMKNAMTRDWSFMSSARRYEQIYQKTLNQ